MKPVQDSDSFSNFPPIKRSFHAVNCVNTFQHSRPLKTGAIDDVKVRLPPICLHSFCKACFLRSFRWQHYPLLYFRLVSFSFLRTWFFFQFGLEPLDQCYLLPYPRQTSFCIYSLTCHREASGFWVLITLHIWLIFHWSGRLDSHRKRHSNIDDKK